MGKREKWGVREGIRVGSVVNVGRKKAPVVQRKGYGDEDLSTINRGPRVNLGHASTW